MAFTHDPIALRDHNTEIVVRDAAGNRRKLWCENRLGRWIRLSLGREHRVPFVTGSWRDTLLSHNLITNTGHTATSARLGGLGSYGTFVNLGIGTSTVTATVTDQALGAEITASGGARGAATATQITVTNPNDTLQLVRTFTLTAAAAVTEEGVFDSATAPASTTLTAALTTAATSATVASGTGISNGDLLQIDSEVVIVTAGAGTTTLTITRAQGGTAAAVHGSGVGVVDVGAGHLLAKQSFAVINLNSGDSLTMTHRITT